jgi:hypothetical protein
MKISKLIFALFITSSFLITSCEDTNSNSETSEEHGHEHDADGNHMNEEHVEQEDFMVDSTSNEMKNETDTHSHDDGSEHHEH